MLHSASCSAHRAPAFLSWILIGLVETQPSLTPDNINTPLIDLE